MNFPILLFLISFVKQLISRSSIQIGLPKIVSFTSIRGNQCINPNQNKATINSKTLTKPINSDLCFEEGDEGYFWCFYFDKATRKYEKDLCYKELTPNNKKVYTISNIANFPFKFEKETIEEIKTNLKGVFNESTGFHTTMAGECESDRLEDFLKCLKDILLSDIHLSNSLNSKEKIINIVKKANERHYFQISAWKNSIKRFSRFRFLSQEPGKEDKSKVAEPIKTVVAAKTPEPAKTTDPVEKPKVEVKPETKVENEADKKVEEKKLPIPETKEHSSEDDEKEKSEENEKPKKKKEFPNISDKYIESLIAKLDEELSEMPNFKDFQDFVTINSGKCDYVCISFLVRIFRDKFRPEQIERIKMEVFAAINGQKSVYDIMKRESQYKNKNPLNYLLSNNSLPWNLWTDSLFFQKLQQLQLSKFPLPEEIFREIPVKMDESYYLNYNDIRTSFVETKKQVIEKIDEETRNIRDLLLKIGSCEKNIFDILKASKDTNERYEKYLRNLDSLKELKIQVKEIYTSNKIISGELERKEDELNKIMGEFFSSGSNVDELKYLNIDFRDSANKDSCLLKPPILMEIYPNSSLFVPPVLKAYTQKLEFLGDSKSARLITGLWMNREARYYFNITCNECQPKFFIEGNHLQSNRTGSYYITETIKLKSDRKYKLVIELSWFMIPLSGRTGVKIDFRENTTVIKPKPKDANSIKTNNTNSTNKSNSTNKQNGTNAIKPISNLSQIALKPDLKNNSTSKSSLNQTKSQNSTNSSIKSNSSNSSNMSNNSNSLIDNNPKGKALIYGNLTQYPIFGNSASKKGKAGYVPPFYIQRNELCPIPNEILDCNKLCYFSLNCTTKEYDNKLCINHCKVLKWTKSELLCMKEFKKGKNNYCNQLDRMYIRCGLTGDFKLLKYLPPRLSWFTAHSILQQDSSMNQEYLNKGIFSNEEISQGFDGDYELELLLGTRDLSSYVTFDPKHLTFDSSPSKLHPLDSHWAEDQSFLRSPPILLFNTGEIIISISNPEFSFSEYEKGELVKNGREKVIYRGNNSKSQLEYLFMNGGITLMSREFSTKAPFITTKGGHASMQRLKKGMYLYSNTHDYLSTLPKSLTRDFFLVSYSTNFR